jgi:hypothetical protein
MGQISLGIRSLLFRLTMFVVMAALLAWILGGTLWPRAEVADFPKVAWQGASWWLREAVGGEERGMVRWTLLRQVGDERIEPWRNGPGEPEPWIAAVGPVVHGDVLYVAYQALGASTWTLAAISGSDSIETSTLADRLEVERQLARMRAGLAPQSAAEAAAAREAVLRAGS